MLSTCTKFALNQRTLDRKPDMKIQKSGIKHLMKKSVRPLAGETASSVRDWKSRRK